MACSSSGPEGNIFTIDARGGSASKIIAPEPTNRTFFLLPFSAPSAAASGQATYTVDIQSAANSSSKTSLQSPPPPVPWMGSASVPALMERVRKEELRRKIDLAQLTKAYRHKLTAYKKPSGIRTQVASTLTIFSPFSGEIDNQITGTLRASSSSSAIYVDSRDNSQVTDMQIQSIKDAYDTVSLPRLHALFGQESDIDDNGVIILYLASSSRIGENELGFFRPIDLLPDGAVAGTKSNEAEIVYGVAPDSMVPVSLSNATLAHETFHLINFGIKSLPSFNNTGGLDLTVESLFLNEGQAHLSEDLTGWGTCSAILARIYLDCLSHTSLAGSGDGSVPGKSYCEIAASGNDSLARRGGMFLFLLYMFQQLGGAKYSTKNAGDISGPGVTFLKALQTSTVVGIDNLEMTSGRSFFSWYSDFAATVALDNTGHSLGDQFNFQKEVKDPFTHLLRNIRLRGSRTDIDGSTITLSGPTDIQTKTSSDSPIANSLFVTGLNAIELTVPANSEITIGISGSTSLDLGMAIVPMP